MTAARRPIRSERNRRPVSKTTIEVQTATTSCAVPTDHQWTPPSQKIGIRNHPYSGWV